MSKGKKGGDTLKSVSQNSTPENLNHSNTQSLSVCLQTLKEFYINNVDQQMDKTKT